MSVQQENTSESKRVYKKNLTPEAGRGGSGKTNKSVGAKGTMMEGTYFTCELVPVSAAQISSPRTWY